MISREVQEVAAKIGEFFLNKHSGDYVATQKAVEALRITQISLAENKVTIELGRPGLLIGRRCEQIDNLGEFLGLKIHIVEATDHILNWLVPVDYATEFGLDDEL